MTDNYFEEKTFQNIEGPVNALEKGTYEVCQFKNCNFENGDFSGFSFIDCKFESCNLSLVKLSKTVLRDVLMVECKMLGLEFHKCSEHGISLSIENSTLDHSTFYGVKLKSTKFIGSSLVSVDFTEADLTNALFDYCNLENAIFENSNLERADFRKGFNFSIDPDRNRMKKAKFSAGGLSGLLGKYKLDIEK